MKNFNAATWKKTGLALSIVIILNVFFNVGLDTFYNAPNYEDFCENEVKARPLGSLESCQEYGGEWIEDGDYSYCDTYNEACYEDFYAAQADYNAVAFVVLTILGTLSVIFALFTQMPMAVANGFLYGGAVSVVIGSMRYWNDMDDYLQFTISGVALILLVLIGVKKLKD